jgi:S1-C subfamily serine protease
MMMKTILLTLLFALPLAAADCPEGKPLTGDLGIGRLTCLGGECDVNGLGHDGHYHHNFSREPVVSHLRAGSPAASMLRDGDAIVAVDDAPITTAEGGRRLANLTPGKSVHLLMRRDGKTFNAWMEPVTGCNMPMLVVTGGSHSQEMEARLAIERERAAAHGNVAGGRTRTMEEQMAMEHARPGARAAAAGAPLDFGMELSCEGCGWRREGSQLFWHASSEPSVAGVTPNGAAAAAGVQPGDVLLDLDGHRFAEDSAAIAALRPGQAVPLTVRRGRQVVALTIIPRSRQTSRF